MTSGVERVYDPMMNGAERPHKEVDVTAKQVRRAIKMINENDEMAGYVIVPVKNFELLDEMVRKGHPVTRDMVLVRRAPAEAERKSKRS